MGQFEETLVFHVDFNNFDRGGKYLKGSLWHASGSHRIPRQGERAVLRDGEGNRCWAVVHDVKGVIVRFELDDSTWVSGEQPAAQTVGAGAGRWNVR
jgi:hypothetical protein